jgi:hypothetical protein
VNTVADDLDQLIGWAKAGVRSGSDGEKYYLMDAENVDSLRDDILRMLERHRESGEQS